MTGGKRHSEAASASLITDPVEEALASRRMPSLSSIACWTLSTMLCGAIALSG